MILKKRTCVAIPSIVSCAGKSAKTYQPLRKINVPEHHSDAPDFAKQSRVGDVIPSIFSHPTAHSGRVLLRPCAPTHLKTRPARTPSIPRLRASIARIIYHHHPTPSSFLPPSTQHATPPARPHPHKPAPAAASEPRNRPAMPESRKHPQERSITDRSGQQYPGEIAAGGDLLILLDLEKVLAAA